MNVLIGNQVKTEHGNYTFADREQAEAFAMTLRQRDRSRAARPLAVTPPQKKSQNRPSAGAR